MSSNNICLNFFTTSEYLFVLVYAFLLDALPLTENYMATENMLKGRAISKHDLGHFFVKCLSTTEWDGKTVGVWGEYK